MPRVQSKFDASKWRKLFTNFSIERDKNVLRGGIESSRIYFDGWNTEKKKETNTTERGILGYSEST